MFSTSNNNKDRKKIEQCLIHIKNTHNNPEHIKKHLFGIYWNATRMWFISNTRQYSKFIFKENYDKYFKPLLNHWNDSCFEIDMKIQIAFDHLALDSIFGIYVKKNREEREGIIDESKSIDVGRNSDFTYSYGIVKEQELGISVLTPCE